uniref:Uncharacterized protein n=1 Tax=Rhizophora mucronata TaxID=61149 RepID=A0A2P2PHQ9_RHIMU
MGKYTRVTVSSIIVRKQDNQTTKRAAQIQFLLTVPL